MTSAIADAAAVPPEQPEATPAGIEKKAAAKKRGARAADVGEPGENVITGSTYAIALVVIVIGAGFLLWRRRQRQLELDATAVSRDPFTSGVVTTVGTGERFNAEHLAKLDWKHFEELVAAYYEKTGVVAERTKAGPDSPVHIKISWKGESRPFALVQCIARPQGLIEVKPLQELLTVLTAEDIRRGYVVTTGKFTVAARDFAEEKHLTLMPGEIFIEKLNALPDSARNEVMQVVMSGDVTTPTCPKCDARMVRSADDPALWHCPTHTDITQPVAK